MSERTKPPPNGLLASTLLVAMPHLRGTELERAVVYAFQYSPTVAMGFRLDRTVESLNLADLMNEQGIGVDPEGAWNSRPVRFGGPLQTGRGFVLHSVDYTIDSTEAAGPGFRVTGTMDVLRDIAAGKGPQRHLMALGHFGWEPKQLEAIISGSDWLCIPADQDIVFDGDVATLWERSIGRVVPSVAGLSSCVGRA